MLHPISETGKSKKIFLRISKGAIISKRNGEVTSFEAISGSLKGIELKEHEFENKKFRNWHILLSDTESGEDYDISVSRDSGVFKSIVRSLVTEQGLENLNDVKIEVYTSKTGFTNAVAALPNVIDVEHRDVKAEPERVLAFRKALKAIIATNDKAEIKATRKVWKELVHG